MNASANDNGASASFCKFMFASVNLNTASALRAASAGLRLSIDGVKLQSAFLWPRNKNAPGNESLKARVNGPCSGRPDWFQAAKSRSHRTACHMEGALHSSDPTCTTSRSEL